MIYDKFVYETFDHAWQSTLARVLMDGSHLDCRNGGSMELIGVDFTVTDISTRLLNNTRRALKRYYAAAELLWYLSGDANISYLAQFAPSYSRFADENGKAYGAYGPRMIDYPNDRSPILIALEMLQRTPETRQCVVSIWHPYDLFTAAEGKCKDIPCTLNLQFFVRDNKLHLIVNMRSNDMWLGTPYDCFCFMSIQALMARALGINTGTYRHCVGSMHIYTSNMKAAAAACKSEFVDRGMIHDEALDSDKAATILRRMAPNYALVPDRSDDWYDDLRLATNLHLGKDIPEFYNPVFREIQK